MASNDHNEAVTSQPTSRNVSRKVSINSDKGHENAAYEHTTGRKISQNSLHGEGVFIRRKSILHNAPIHPPYVVDDVVSVTSGKTCKPHTHKHKQMQYRCI